MTQDERLNFLIGLLRLRPRNMKSSVYRQTGTENGNCYEVS